MAQRGNVDYGQLRQTARKGVGAQVQMFGGGLTTNGHVAVFNANGDIVDGGAASGGAGTVTSVALTMPPEFAVAGSPITAAGTFAVSKPSQAQNLVWASPSGAAGPPVFRALVAADMPAGVGQPQTPWQQPINANGFALSNVPSITGQTALAIASSGASPITLATNAKTRMTIDSAGVVTINMPDAGSALLLNSNLDLKGNNIFGLQSITGSVNTNTISFNTADMVLNSSSGGRLLFKTGTPPATTRLTIDAAGHVIIAKPDDAGQVIQLTGGVANILATAGNLGVAGTPILYLQGAGATGQVQALTGASSALRFTIDSAGHVIIAAPDDANPVLQLAGAGLQVISAAASIQIKSAATTYLTGQGTVILQAGAANRLSIDSAGHVTIGAPDDSATLLTAAGPVRCYSGAGVADNAAGAYAAKLLQTINTGTSHGALIANAWAAAASTALLVANINPSTGALTNWLRIDGIGVAVFSNAAGYSTVFSAGTAAANGDPYLTMTGQWYGYMVDNTHLWFRMRGSDGVIRQGSLMLA